MSLDSRPNSLSHDVQKTFSEKEKALIEKRKSIEPTDLLDKKPQQEDIIDEAAIARKTQETQDKIQNATLPEGQKSELNQRLEQIVYARIQQLAKISLIKAKSLQASVKTLEQDLDEFLHRPEVQEALEVVSPKMERATSIIANFSKNANIPLGQEAQNRYATAYIESFTQLPLDKIDHDLTIAAQLTSDRTTLLQALGKLVNGYAGLDNEFYKKTLSQLDTELANAVAKATANQEKLSKLQANNPLQGLYEARLNSDRFFGADLAASVLDEHVRSANNHYELQASLQREAEQNANKINQIKQQKYLALYSYAAAQGSDTSGLLRAMYADLGPDGIPDSLQDQVELALEEKVADPDASQFEKDFFSGNYDGALSSLRLEHAKDQLGEGGKKFSPSEIVSLYEQVQTSRTTPGTFANHKMKEGFALLPTKPIRAMAKRYPDGSFGVFYISPDESADKRNPGEIKFSAQQLQDSVASQKSFQEYASQTIAKMPGVQMTMAASRDIQSKLQPLQALAKSPGQNTMEFVTTLKGYAFELQNSAAVNALKQNIEQATWELGALKLLPVGYRSQFEAQITEMSQALEKTINVIEEGTLDKLCSEILSPNFQPDSLKTWFLKEGITMMTTVLVAVTATLLVMTTAGAGLALVPGLLLSSGVGAASSIIGSEIGHKLSEEAGQVAYGQDYQNDSLLEQYIDDQEVYNPHTGKYEMISGSVVANAYGKQFVHGFVTTFALMGLGKLAGSALSRHAVNNAAAKGGSGATARLAARIPKLNVRVDLSQDTGVKYMLQRVSREYLEELGEETAEAVAEKVSKANGFLASMYFCLSPGRVKYSAGNVDIAQTNRTFDEKDGRLTTHYRFAHNDADNMQAWFAKMQNQGWEVQTDQESGKTTLTQQMTTKDGKITAAMEFQQTSENIILLENKTELETLYGLKYDEGTQTYTYTNANPEGAISLADYLRQKGVVVEATQNHVKVQYDNKVYRIEQEISEGEVIASLESRVGYKNILKYMDQKYSPESLVSLLDKHFQGIYERDSGVSEGYSLRDHTLSVLKQFDKHFASAELPGGFDMNFFRLCLALHDIGKIASINETGHTSQQHIHTVKTISKFFETIHVPVQMQRVALRLVGSDRIGTLLKFETDVATTSEKVAVSLTGIDETISPKDFVDLLRIFYICDASSYSSFAGNEPSLDHLFQYDDAGNIMLKPEFENRIADLREQVHLRYNKSHQNIQSMLDEYHTVRDTPLNNMGYLLQGVEAMYQKIDREGAQVLTMGPMPRDFTMIMNPTITIEMEHVVEAREILDNFNFSYFTGAPSAIFDGLQDSKYRILSARKINEEGLSQKTGEGNAFGGSNLAESIYGAKGLDGAGVALAYAFGREQLLNFDNLTDFQLNILHDQIDYARSRIDNMTNDEIASFFWTPTQLPINQYKDFALDRISEIETILELRKIKGNAGVLYEDRFPVVFGFESTGNDQLIEEVEGRLYGGALSGEIRMGESIDLKTDRKKVIFVPSAQVENVKSFISKADISNVTVYSIEAMVVILASSETGLTPFKETFNHAQYGGARKLEHIIYNILNQ